VWHDWLISMLNARPACNDIGWISIACVTHVAWLGPGLAIALLACVYIVPAERLAFAFLGLAIIAAAPDTYAPYWLIPWATAVPLISSLFRRRSQSSVRDRGGRRRNERKYDPASPPSYPGRNGQAMVDEVAANKR
jgi:hypothetical protein